MPITQTQWFAFALWTNSSLALTLNIAPAAVGVQTSLSMVDGAGLKEVGVTSIRKRLPSGVDQDIDVGYKPFYFGRAVTSITIEARTDRGKVAVITKERVDPIPDDKNYHTDSLQFLARIDWWV